MNSTKETIKVMLVDDRGAIHLAIEQILALEGNIRVIAHCNSGQDAIDMYKIYKPDLVLMDVIMPGMNGIEATRELKGQYPNAKVVALSSFHDIEAVKGMLEAGAVGYVLKTTDALMHTLGDTIRDLYNGQSVLSPEILTTLLEPASSKLPNSPNQYGLTRRELGVLRYMTQGKNNNEIATALTVSLSTIKHHVSNILKKLDVTTRTEAVSIAIKQRLVN